MDRLEAERERYGEYTKAVCRLYWLGRPASLCRNDRSQNDRQIHRRAERQVDGQLYRTAWLARQTGGVREGERENMLRRSLSGTHSLVYVVMTVRMIDRYIRERQIDGQLYRTARLARAYAAEPVQPTLHREYSSLGKELKLEIEKKIRMEIVLTIETYISLVLKQR